MSELYWLMRGDTMADAVKKVKKLKKEDMTAMMVNDALNLFVHDHADYQKDEEDEMGHGKRIPYIGWFWRDTDFYHKKIAIGDCGEFVGVMENNKWDYPERYLTEEEADKVIAIIWDARKASQTGGELGQIIKNTNDKLDELWDLFQTFDIEPSDDDE